MPQRTEGGLPPTHQPPTTEYHYASQRPNPDEGRQQERIHDTLRQQSLNVLEQTRKPSRTRSRQDVYSNTQNIRQLQENLCIAYNRYCKHYHIEWQMPKYDQEAKNVALPTREKLEMLIANAKKILSMKLQLSMETGLRPVELSRLKVKDIDLDHRTVNPTTAKRGNPRTLPMTTNLTNKIQEHITGENLNPNDQLFKGQDADYYGKQYRAMRNRLSTKLKDPSLRTIRLYDFRHYFCTKKLYDINNPYTVMVLMGHKKLETTMKYMHLMNLDDDEWSVVGATTAKEATNLLEHGFQYQTTIEGIQLFKKRK